MGLVDRSALELSRAIRQREVSCVDVAQAHLDRVDALDGSFHALSSRRPRDDVLTEAAERDDELDRGIWRGWMHGLPHAVKDLADVRGLPTTMGFRPVSESPVAAEDDPFVAHLRVAGAIFIGKTNTPEFGLGSHTYNGIGPTTRNVANPALSSGGSSGGAAVSVATGMTPVADGSDFMGSLRNPPGWNGVLGLRPTAGLVPVRGDDPVEERSGVDGPIARTVADLHALLATMAGPDAVPRLEVPPPEVTPRIGWLGDLQGYLPFEDGILDTCVSTVRAWCGRADDVTLPSSGAFTGVTQLWPTWLSIRHHEVGGWLAAEFDPSAIEEMKPEAQWEIAGFRALTERQLTHARLVRSGLRQAMQTLLGEFDVLALPTAQCWPFPAMLHWPAAVNGVPMDTYHRWMEVTTLATIAGSPAVSIPAGVDADRRHMGLQLIGRPRGDAALLAWAAHAERAGVFVVTPPGEAVRATPEHLPPVIGRGSRPSEP
jgi:amidase